MTTNFGVAAAAATAAKNLFLQKLFGFVVKIFFNHQNYDGYKQTSKQIFAENEKKKIFFIHF